MKCPETSLGDCESIAILFRYSAVSPILDPGETAMTDQIRPGDDAAAATPPSFEFHNVMLDADTQTGSSTLSTIGSAIADGYIYVSNLFKADPKIEQGIQKCMEVRGGALGVDPTSQRKFCDGSTPMYVSGDYPVAVPYGVPKR
jgi:hypothetical protein